MGEVQEATAVEKRVHSMDDVLTFGKYRGLTVADVVSFNPGYFAWAVKNLAWFDLDAEARKLGQRALNEHREFARNQQEAWAYGFGLDAKTTAERRRSRLFHVEYNCRRRAGQELDRLGKWRSAKSEGA